MSEKAALDRALHHASEYLESLETRSVITTATHEELTERLDIELQDKSLPAEQVIDELARGVEGGLLTTGGGRFFAWAIGGTLPAALAADWLSAAWDQNAGIYACSPALAILENTCGNWLKDVLGLPPSASFAFVTGCQMAHVTALAAARHKLLADRGWDVEKRGLAGAPQITIHTGELRHESILRAARFLGLGLDAVRHHPCSSDGQLDLDAVEASLDDGPSVIVLQAGEFNTGNYDDFPRAAALARKHKGWVHVDGAIGLWAAASDKTRHLMKGCELLDSWATDGHKWLNLPFDTGFVFVAHPEAHKQSMTIRASYFSAGGEGIRDQIDWGPEWSRRARSVPAYAALRSLGRRGLEELVDRCCEHARAIVAGIGALPGVEVVSEPIINQGILRFLAKDGDHDRRTDEVIDRIQAKGVTWFGGSNWRGTRVMRVIVLNWRTREKDVADAIESVRQVLEELDG